MYVRPVNSWLSFTPRKIERMHPKGCHHHSISVQVICNRMTTLHSKVIHKWICTVVELRWCINQTNHTHCMDICNHHTFQNSVILCDCKIISKVYFSSLRKLVTTFSWLNSARGNGGFSFVIYNSENFTKLFFTKLFNSM